MNHVSRTLWTLGSLIGVQLATRVARSIEVNDLLGLVGLRRRRPTLQVVFPAIGLISLGAAAGAGVALLIAPSSGAEFRLRLSERVDKLTEKLAHMQNRKSPKISPIQDSHS